MKVLIVGSGGREHALYNKLSKDKSISRVFVIGNNGGIETKDLLSDVDDLDFAQIEKTITENNVGLTIIGPEFYLEAGLSDYLRSNGHKVFAPSKYCSQLESSKHFAKQMMEMHDVPTAKYKYVETITDGLTVCEQFGYPVVLKYDGLAAGKGVLVCPTKQEAVAYFEDVFGNNKYGNCGVVVEECLVGEEYSVFAVCNGSSYQLLPVAQDYKRALDNDYGLNTGGMGVNTTDKFNDQLPFITQKILEPILNEFVHRDNPYNGFLYIGLMQTINGPKVIEFNTRLGDPETEIILPKLKTSLLDVIDCVLEDTQLDIEFDEKQYVGVTIASKGYPEAYEKDVILDIRNIKNQVVHMGTKISNNKLLSTGGRIFQVVASGETVSQARFEVYADLNNIVNPKLYWRNDIGKNRM